MTPPLRFLTGIGLGWTGLRALLLLAPLPWLAVGPVLLPDGPKLGRAAVAADLALASAAPVRPLVEATPETQVVAAALIVLRHLAPGPAMPPLAPATASAVPVPASLPSSPPDAPALALGITDVGSRPAVLAPPSPVPGGGVWSGTAWLFARRGGIADPAAPGGMLGGSQAGARVEWRPSAAAAMAVAARVSGPLGSRRGTEAALGIDLAPVRSLPVRVSAERRIALDRGGRNAWTAYVAGGAYDRKLPGGFRLDGYGEAGVVGARRRDLFADGGVRVGKPLPVGDRATVTIGAGGWGAAQPGAARLDIGPQAALRVPIGKTGITAAADWRVRVAGHAAPRSGPALTVGIDF